jgi:hypothetical protein
MELGSVPDQEAATSIAEAVWIPIYGHETVEAQKPLQAKLLSKQAQ